MLCPPTRQSLIGDTASVMVHQPQHAPPTSKGFDLSRWHFDIDAYLNPYLPAPIWRWLPRPVSHFLGYRGDQPPKAVGNLLIAFWALIGAFCGVLVVAEVCLHVPSFQAHHAPIIVASFVSISPWIQPLAIAEILIVDRAPRRCLNSLPSIPHSLNLEI